MRYNNYDDLDIDNLIKHTPTIVRDPTMISACYFQRYRTVSAQALSNILIISTGWLPGVDHGKFK